MTLLGKIFTMLIFMMSLLWMAFAIATYTTQKVWRDVALRPESEVKGEDTPLGLKWQLEKSWRLSNGVDSGARCRPSTENSCPQ